MLMRGMKNMALLGGSEDIVVNQTRYAGVVDAHEQFGKKINDNLVFLNLEGKAYVEKAVDDAINLKTTRDIIDSFPEYKGLQIHITEFNSSYTPQGVIHDTNLNAALIAQQLSRLGDVNESYSYWTFGDVFEELGVPFTPFHGGFGLVANGCITKPTFWTFAFYKKLEESEAN